MHPPKTTDGVTPINFAATPLSNCPNSLLEFMNIEFTDITRPRSSRGVFSCRIVPLTTTLTPSNIPANIKATNESKNHLDRAKIMIQAPNPATAKNNFLPWFRCSGAIVSNTTMQIEPISDAALSHPKPCGPTWRISFANTGTIATIRRRIEPSKTLWAYLENIFCEHGHHRNSATKQDCKKIKGHGAQYLFCPEHKSQSFFHTFPGCLFRTLQQGPVWV